MEKDPRIYIRHILEAIANIETDTAGYDFEQFRSNSTLGYLQEGFDAIERRDTAHRGANRLMGNRSCAVN
jgi:hypothetical protein